MNGKALIPLIAGLGIGGFALWMGFNTLKSAQGAPRQVEVVEVWSANTDIPRGTQVTEEMVVPLSFPPELVPEGAVKDKTELVGRVPRLDAPAGLPILESMLMPPGARPGIHVKPGYRAVAVQIDSGSGVDYHLEPGSYVDVVGSFSVRRDGRPETLARTILENVEVAAVGPRLSPVTTEDGDKKHSSRVVRAVTLFVRPDDVPRLLLAEQKGRIKLSLRSDADTGRLLARDMVSDRELTGEEMTVADEAPSDTLFDRLKNMFAQPEESPDDGLTIAVRPRVCPVWEVAIYRGQQKETVRFKNRDSREQAETGPQRAQIERNEDGRLPPDWFEQLEKDAEDRPTEEQPEPKELQE